MNRILLENKRRRKCARRVEVRWDLRQKKLQNAPLGQKHSELCTQTTGDVHRARRKAREEAS